MSERYQPPSAFLRAAIDDEVPLVGSAYAEANLRRLIALTRDEQVANRDWATLLIAQQDFDTPAIREALLNAAADENIAVRAEAILGLAQRSREVALPLLQAELKRASVAWPILEAATLVAHPSLVNDLRAFATPSGDAWLDGWALDALKACEAGRPL